MQLETKTQDYQSAVLQNLHFHIIKYMQVCQEISAAFSRANWKNVVLSEAFADLLLSPATQKPSFLLLWWPGMLSVN